MLQLRWREIDFSVVLIIVLLLSSIGESSPTASRLLQQRISSNDFDALNSILQHGIFYIGDASVTDAKVAELQLSTMRCQDMLVGDIRLESQKINPRQVQVNVSILDLDMRCDLNYSYTTALLLKGAGKAIAVSKGNSVNTTTIVESTGVGGSLASKAADKIVVDTCKANMNVTDMEFPDGILLGFAPVEALIKLSLIHI